MEWILGGAAIAAIISLYGYIKGFILYIVGLLIVSCEFNGNSKFPILYYLNEKCSNNRFGLRIFEGEIQFIKTIRKKGIVTYENIGSGKIYWHGFVPILISRLNDKSTEGYRAYAKPLVIRYIRFTFDLDKFIIRCNEAFNKERYSETHIENRYKIHYCHGIAKNIIKEDKFLVNDDVIDVHLLSCKIIGLSRDNIGPDIPKIKTIDYLYLNQQQKNLINLLQKWMNKKEWFCDRNIPWKLGVLLHGRPGTGKTSFIRAIAEKHNLPIYIYDLHTLRNDELRKNWEKMCSDLPAIALIEDIDCIFNKRNNISEHSEISFDCLLNCIDGIERSNGVLFFVTTNNLDFIDEGLTKRHGRIDFNIKLDDINENVKKHIASNILKDWPEQAKELIKKDNSKTPAEFEFACVDLAQKLFIIQENEQET